MGELEEVVLFEQGDNNSVNWSPLTSHCVILVESTLQLMVSLYRSEIQSEFQISPLVSEEIAAVLLHISTRDWWKLGIRFYPKRTKLPSVNLVEIIFLGWCRTTSL